jgi:hypothetical protein
VVLLLGLADEEERQRIADEGIVAKQLRWIADDRKHHPEEYKGLAEAC